MSLIHSGDRWISTEKHDSILSGSSSLAYLLFANLFSTLNGIVKHVFSFMRGKLHADKIVKRLSTAYVKEGAREELLARFERRLDGKIWSTRTCTLDRWLTLVKRQLLNTGSPCT